MSTTLVLLNRNNIVKLSIELQFLQENLTIEISLLYRIITVSCIYKVNYLGGK